MVRADDGDRVAQAMTATPRAQHLPPDQQPYAALDRALPIGFGQTNSQPSTVAAMLRGLDVQPGQRVLDVGAGSGWTTVLLARLVGPQGQVVGVERVPELTERAARAVTAAGMPWAHVEQADPAVVGCPAYPPFDRVLVSAAAVELPLDLLGQLTPDGVMVVPVAGRLLRVRPGDPPRVEDLGAYVFVPLVRD